MVLTTTEVIMTLGFLVSLSTFAFGVWKYVEAKITAVRTECKAELVATKESWSKALDANRLQHQSELQRMETRVESTRAECARREDIQRITEALAGLGTRFDHQMDVMHRRIDDLMKMRAETLASARVGAAD